ncbi:hypothetical protein ES708_10231 [subsurface metagenome]
MSLLIKGLEKLSQLEIDADKDWLAKGITNIKEIAESMAKGDLAVRGNTVLVKFPPSTIGLVLTSAGPGHMLTWQPGAALEFYLPVPVDLSHAEQIVPVDQSHNENAPLTSEHVQAYDDAPALLIRRRDSVLVLVDAASPIAAADKFIPRNAPHLSALSILCDGFVEEAAFDVGTHDAADSLTIMTDSARAAWVVGALVGSTIYNTTDGSSGVITANTAQTATVLALIGGVDQTWQNGDAYIIRTDHTDQARDAAVNDLNLCPMSDTVLDKIYIGSLYPFWQAQFQVGTNGADNWTNEPYYWNGAWAACMGGVDGSNSFLHGTGLKFITHTPQGDWALSTIMGMNLYWMMIRTDVWTNRITKPLGTQVWVAIA